jgi:cation diffusion facilitator family transporter
MKSDSPAKYALYSVAAALVTLALKFGAWWLTDSVGLLSDALEAVVNLTAAGIAFTALVIARMPADRRHAYGHGKAEFVAGAIEGLLVLAAAAGIVAASINRFMHPTVLSRLDIGLVIALVAAGVNLYTARLLLKAGRRFDSMTLEADARHLMTDVWTSVGMVAGLAVLIFAPPRWHILDPIAATLMAANIARTGVDLVRRSVQGLMDRALPKEEIEAIEEAITRVAGQDIRYHGLRTRKSGNRRFADFHLLVPGKMTVKASHDLTCDIEDAIRARLDKIQVTIHTEPLEDEASWDGERVGGECDGRGHDESA